MIAFTAIFSNVCTAHAQQRLFMFFRCKFRQRRSIPRPRFPVRKQNFGDLATFSVDFCFLYYECPPIVRCLLLINYSKAFDTVNHQIVFTKLQQLHLPPTILTWIINFHNVCRLFSLMVSSQTGFQ